MARPKKKIIQPLLEDDPLRSLLALITSDTTSITISQYETKGWDPAKYKALLTSGLLTESIPLREIQCDRCELQCAGLPVIRRGDRYWILCENRDDVNRIPVSESQMQSYCFSIEALKDYLFQLFNCQPYISNSQESSDSFIIGVVHSGKLRLVPKLSYRNLKWIIESGGNELCLNDLFGFDGESYVLQSAQKEYLLTAEKSDEPRDLRRARLLATVNLCKTFPIITTGKAIYEYIAEQEGIKKTTIENELKVARQDRAVVELSKVYLKDMLDRHQSSQ